MNFFDKFFSRKAQAAKSKHESPKQFRTCQSLSTAGFWLSLSASAPEAGLGVALRPKL
jgi:hypothetical protein